MDKATKVIYPILSEMMTNSPQLEKELTTPQPLLKVPFPSENSLEDLSVTLGGHVKKCSLSVELTFYSVDFKH